MIDVILPCLDEAEALPWVLSRMPEHLSAIVVDNGSTDGSDRIAEQLGARVVHAEQRGYGAACHAGLLAATAPVVAVMDADGSLDPQQLHRVLDPVLDGECDLMLGCRRPTTRGAFPWQLRFANQVLAGRIRRRTGLGLRDLGPMRAANRERLLALGLTDRRSGYPAETVVRAADAGWRIGQVWVDYLPRRGLSKVTGTPLGVWRAVRDMSAAIAR
ncbi:MAG: Putative glycosyltransferase [uncultured Propionibacteriaceae bacterium]|uniref:Glycosyltransferase n=1 Tax=uncultured Propionibacteriaceae bacterium TaxID=257457 RepID=A0A6J4N2Z2_9ACTN|nr:MAG: Putative glycosyltransferase [uncultured Propionibacteriaceae bacterium]